MKSTSAGRLAALFAFVALASCGGGGGSGSSPTPPPPPPPPPAPAPVPASVTISGTNRIEVGASDQFTTDVKAPAGLTFAWDFGDGTTGTGTAPQHVYAEGGNYHVSLTVSNSANQSVGAGFNLQAAHYTNVANLLCSGANFGGWCWENDLVTGHELTSAQFFPNANAGWVIGREGTLVRTVDGGDTWSLHVLNSLDDLVALNFRSSLEGVVLTRSGALWHSLDGGKTWAALTPPGSTLAHPSVATLDGTAPTERIVITDDHGTQTSLDGGAHWIPTSMRHAFTAGANCWSYIGNVTISADCIHTPVAAHVGAAPGTVFFAGATIGTGARIVLLGQPTVGTAVSFTSLDGGVTWTQAATPFITGGSLRLPDVKHAWYIDADKNAWLSSDGAQTFASAPVPADAPVARQAGLIDTGSTMFWAWTGKLAFTTDYGVTFAEMASPEPATDPATVTALHLYIWDGVGHAVVSYDGRYYVTHDKGVTWTRVLGPDPLGTWMVQQPEIRPAIAFGDGKHGTLVMSSGLLQATADGGRTWSRTAVSLTQPTRSGVSVTYSSATTAWMTLDGRAWISTNAGATWAASTSAAAFKGVTLTAWPDAQNGWLAAPGALYTTTDAGTTWKVVALGSLLQAGDAISSMSFENAQIGLVGVTRGTGTVVLRTADGGATWQQVTSMPDLGDVMHTADKDFWLGGASPLVSLDEGVTWKSAIPPVGAASLQIFGGPRSSLYAFDRVSGHVYASDTVGAIWVDLTLSTDIVVGAGFALDPMTAWTVTQDGAVLTTATAAQ
jgi:photosystem II stability/assembly factor-like uncharacterized protein